MDKKIKIMTYIVSILSDQPIPTVAFIKEMSKPGYRHIFITSEKILKTDLIENIKWSCHITDSIIVTIDANRAQQIYTDLLKYNWDKSAEYIVNITGGNKLMSQMVFSFMYSFDNAKMYYFPIESTIAQVLHPHLEEENISEAYYLNLETYFKAFGFTLKVDKKQKPEQLSEDIFNRIIESGSVDTVPEIKKMSVSREKHQDKRYYTGTWFEEYVHSRIQRLTGISDTHIAFGVKFKKQNAQSHTESDLESDIVIIHNNKLCLIECKVFRGEIKGTKLTNPIYKIASIGNMLGLRVPKYIIILGNLSKDVSQKRRLEDMKRELGVTDVFSMSDFNTERDPFKVIINSLK